ncbi:MAG: alpha-E domain-containing protein [Clostridia bacterium]|nr:alpha-E domain-containing protein [Clostridia bacterium]
MGIISVEQVDHLYWLGRYTERVYTTLKIFERSFDRMIDEGENLHNTFCEALDIPNIYESDEDFLSRYPFDETIADSIISNLNRAYDNAIVLRETIGSEALSYVQLAIYSMTNAKNSVSPLIELQQITDDLLAFWGIVDDWIDSEQTRNIIKAGKRIERIDLYTRLELDRERIEREIKRMIPRVLRSGINYRESSLCELQTLIHADFLNYDAILNAVESVIE